MDHVTSSMTKRQEDSNFDSVLDKNYVAQAERWSVEVSYFILGTTYLGIQDNKNQWWGSAIILLSIKLGKKFRDSVRSLVKSRTLPFQFFAFY